MKNKTLTAAAFMTIFIAAAVLTDAGNVIVRNGQLNVSGGIYGDSDTFYIDSENDRVGIGTTSPGWKLTVGSPYAGIHAANEIVTDTGIVAGSSGGLGVGLTSGGGTYGSVYAYNWSTSAAMPLVLNEYGSNVGIGTTSPEVKLNVQTEQTQAVARFVNHDTDGYRGIEIGGAPAGAGQHNYIKVYGTTSPLYFTDKDDQINVAILDNGYVGIATTSPAAQLQITGTTNQLRLHRNATAIASGTHLGVLSFSGSASGSGAVDEVGCQIKGMGDNGWGEDDSPGRLEFLTVPDGFDVPVTQMVIKSDGNVGIGTASPGGKLDIRMANTHTSGVYTGYGNLFLFNNQTNEDELGAFLTFGSYYNDGTDKVTTRAAIKGGTDTAGNNGAGYLAFYTVPGSSSFQNTERMRIDKSGNVGIGTTAPGEKLEIANGRLRLSSTGYNVWAFEDSLGNLELNTSSSSNRYLRINNVASGWAGLTVEGNVGIGTTAPGDNLEVYESGDAPYIGLNRDGDKIWGISINSGGNLAFQSGGTWTALRASTPKLWIENSTGNVGIGTTSPVGHISSRKALIVSDTTNDALIEVWGTLGGKALLQSVAGVTYVGSVAKGSGAGDTALLYGDGSTGITISGSTGNIGIGTTSPESKLQVTGGGLCVGSDANCNSDNNNEGVVYSSSTSMTQYDVAEEYPTRENLSEGDVLVLDPDNPVFVKRSVDPYDALVLGVVSSKPGVLLGGFNGDQYRDEMQVAVALSGRVPVKVSGENGPIQVGDALVSSSVGGHAMKASETGKTLGIALEPFSGDEGTIMCFVNIGMWVSPGEFGQLKADNEALKVDNVVLKKAVCEINPQAEFCSTEEGGDEI